MLLSGLTATRLIKAEMLEIKIMMLTTRLQREFAQQAVALDEGATAGLPGGAAAPELTLRQQEVLVLVAEGFTYKEVAAVLNLSENTIKYQVGQVL